MRRLKYEMCKNWREKGQCKYGDKCLFAHGDHELTKRSSLNGPEPKTPANTAPAAETTKEATATIADETEVKKTEDTASIVIKDSAKDEVTDEKKDELAAKTETTSLFMTPIKEDESKSKKDNPCNDEPAANSNKSSD